VRTLRASSERFGADPAVVGALGATYLPARQATRVDPLPSIRNE